MSDVDPRIHLASERLDELTTAIYEPPLSLVRESVTFPDLDDPLDVTVLLIDADTEIEMHGVSGFIGNISKSLLRSTVEALECVGAHGAAAALVAAEAGEAVEMHSLFNRRYVVRDAHTPLLTWLSERLGQLDARLAAAGYRWRSSAGIGSDRCPICGEDGVVAVVDHAVGMELRWSRSFRCTFCGHAVEEDDVGPLPEPYRSAAIARDGLWGARPATDSETVHVASAIGRAFGLRPADALSRARSTTRLVVTGTRAEATQAVTLLRTQGIACELVRVDEAERPMNQ